MGYFDPELLESRYWGAAKSDDDANADYLLNKPIHASPNMPSAKDAPTAGEIGMSANPFEHQAKSIGQAIRAGASRIELGVMSAGGKQGYTPAHYSPEEREELHNMAKINKVETSFHASPNVNMSGFDGRSFNEAVRKKSLDEIKKAVEFAAEATTGGAVVLHVNEWQRSIGGEFGTDEKAKYQFQSHDKDFKDSESKSGYGAASMMFVDTQSEQIQAIRRDREFVEADVKTVTIESKNNNPYLTYEYEKDESTGELKTQKLYYEDIIKLEEKMHNENDKVYGEYAKFAKDTFKDLDEDWNRIQKMDDGQEKKDAIFLHHFMRKQADQAYEQFLGADSSYRYHKSFRQRGADEDTERMIKESELRRNMAWVAFQDKLKDVNNLETVNEYGAKKAAQTVAEAALYAFDKSQNNKRLGDKHLYISPESYDPEAYGSHPDEMMNVIDKSRNMMANRLLHEGKAKNETEAEKLSREYIKGTLDIGHMNMWRKNFVKNEKESWEDYHKRFNKWAIEKTAEMAEKGYLGHAHLSDNFGYDDDHLSVGQGNAPIKEFVETLRKKGLKEFIVEMSDKNTTTVLQDAWSHLGTKMTSSGYFNIDSRRSSQFQSLYDSYIPHLRKPNYVYGKYIPEVTSDKWNNWRPWSGVRL